MALVAAMPPANQASKRDTLIDLCRGIAIALVVYGHALEITFIGQPSLQGTQFAQWKFIYSFHLPLFFFISGLVYRAKPLRQVLVSSVNLLLVALGSHLVGAVVFYLHGEYKLFQVFAPLYRLTSFSIVVTWYLVAQAFVQLAYAVAQRGRWPVRMAAIAVLVALYGLNQATGRTDWQIQAIGIGTLFYGLGHIGKAYLDRIRAMRAVAVLVAGIVLLAVSYSLAQLNHGCAFDYYRHCKSIHGDFAVFLVAGKTGFLPLFLIGAVTGIGMVLLLSSLVERLRFAALTQAIVYLGANTLDFLLVNGFFFSMVQPAVLRRLNVETSLSASLLWGGGLFLVQVLILLMGKPVTRFGIQICQTAARMLVDRVPTAPRQPVRGG